MSLPFLRAESEETATQAAAFIAVCIITVGLCTMNVMGVLAGSQGTSIGQWVIRIALAVIVCGAELLGAVILVRVMLAPNRLRKVIGALIFLGVAWACIQNGKRAVHLIYPEFAESSALLEAKAGIAGEEAALVSEARGKAIDATPEELARVRTDIAALKAEQQLMASQSPEKIKEAQSLLIAQGKYFGRVDGLRQTLTEAAMRSRGEEIARELTNLGLREEALAAGAVTAAAGVAAGVNPAVLQADLADRARKAREATIWLEVMLWVFEIARSFGLWALVTTITAKKNLGAVVEGVSDDVPSGHTRVEMPTEQWEAYQRAFEVHGNIKTGAKKGAKTRRQGNKIEAADDYYRDKIAGWMEAHNQGVPTVSIANGSGMTVAQMRTTYGPHMSVEEHDALFFSDILASLDKAAAEPETEPEPVADEPEQADNPPADELSIPPEPLEYPISPYEPPANDQNKDAA
jgi:hypothetical protein